MKIAISYTLFAVIAIIANIGAQNFSLRIYGGIHSVTASVFVGTAVGLVVKYVLDKKYIFKYKIKGIAHDTSTFILYSVMGLLTTAVFWGFEFGFEYAFESKGMRYLGGVIGLTIGYLIKYRLDKNFVFRSEGG